MRSYFNDRRNRCQLKRTYQTELIKNPELVDLALHPTSKKNGSVRPPLLAGSFSSLPFWMRPMGFPSDDLSPYTNRCVFCPLPI
jgi:hypothetical protein